MGSSFRVPSLNFVYRSSLSNSMMKACRSDRVARRRCFFHGRKSILRALGTCIVMVHVPSSSFFFDPRKSGRSSKDSSGMRPQGPSAVTISVQVRSCRFFLTTSLCLHFSRPRRNKRQRPADLRRFLQGSGPQVFAASRRGAFLNGGGDSSSLTMGDPDE